MSCRVEDEAVLDRGAAFVKHICDEEEVEGELDDKYLAELSKCPGHQSSFLNSLRKFHPLHLWEDVLHYCEDCQKPKHVNWALCACAWVCTQRKVRQIPTHGNKIASFGYLKEV